MKHLKTIRDTDLHMDTPSPERYKERNAARAVVFDEDGNVALLHSKVNNYHKLPGGGIEEGEEMMAALRREVLEEIGCDVEDIQELGHIEEFRNKLGLHQMSHCFTAKLKGEKGEPHLEEGEIAEGFVTEWMPLSEAIQAIASELDTDHYEAKFMTTRDLTFLKEAEKNL